MSRKATIDNLFVRRPEAQTSTSAVDNPGRVRTGAIATMGSHIRELTESARVAADLQDKINSGGAVIEIDTGLIEQSMVKDRIYSDVDPDFDQLVESFRESGQQVPILVRPILGDRFQIAFGHRRVRAAAKLGVRVRAIVRDLTDQELVVAQGKENLERKDLSFIEKALFARHLEDQGFDRSVIMAALSTEKGNLSRYISVARSIPEPIVQAIGPANRAGRARWTTLAGQLPDREGAAERAIADPQFKLLDSDRRFAAVLNALSRRPPDKLTRWVAGKAARVELKGDKTVFTVDESIAPEFGAFLSDRLEGLYQEYKKRREQSSEGR